MIIRKCNCENVAGYKKLAAIKLASSEKVALAKNYSRPLNEEALEKWFTQNVVAPQYLV